jgi:hypothetical protein
VPHVTNAPRAQQDKSDSPQYFICLKNGRLRPVDVPPGTLAVAYRGEWRVVFSRPETDAEYFAAHPEARFRLKVYRSRRYAPDYFTFKITTRDPKVCACGDKWDGFFELNLKPGTPRERLIRVCLRMLLNENRCYNTEGARRLLSDPSWLGLVESRDPELWRLVMDVIEPQMSALQ